MGNQQSNHHGLPFARGGGNSLGLSRSELDKRCQPSGLYDSCAWDDKAIRKMIGDGKLAARCKGSEYEQGDTPNECPICFLFYKDINVTHCCSASLCTECFLQVRPQKEKQSSCPFCNQAKLTVQVQKVGEKLQPKEAPAPPHQQQQQQQLAVPPQKNAVKSEPPECNPTPCDGFGSSLNQDARVALMRARSESFASSEGGNGSSAAGASSNAEEASLIQSFAMTAEERRRLEHEMRAQLAHPLAQRMEAEAQERRLENDRAYYRSHSGNLRMQRAAEQLLRGSRRHNRNSARGGQRNWNNIVEAFERGGHGEVQSLDDLVVLEAAIVLSMEEENRRGRPSGSASTSSRGFDPTRHARDGFPLVRSFLAGHDAQEEEPNAPSSQDVHNLARALRSSRRRNQLHRSRGGAGSSNDAPDTALETAAMLMRGISEEEQLAMAIAASLQDQGNDDTSAAADADDGSNSSDANSTPSSSQSQLVGENFAVGVVIEEEEEEEEEEEDEGDDDEDDESGIGSVGDPALPQETPSTEVIAGGDDSPTDNGVTQLENAGVSNEPPIVQHDEYVVVSGDDGDGIVEPLPTDENTEPESSVVPASQSEATPSVPSCGLDQQVDAPAMSPSTSQRQTVDFTNM